MAEKTSFRNKGRPLRNEEGNRVNNSIILEYCDEAVKPKIGQRRVGYF